MEKSSYPHKCVKEVISGVFVTAMVKHQQFVTSKPDEVHHQGRAAIQQLTAPAVTSKFVLVAHYDVSVT